MGVSNVSKQDRQGVRTPADIERRYNLGSLGPSFAEVMGVSTDAREAVDRLASELRSEFTEQVTSIARDSERIVMAALESYAETGDLETLERTVKGEMEVMAEKISMNFETTTSQIANVNGDLQTIEETLQKHFEFTVDGLTIKAGEDSMSLLIDNDIIHFQKNGQEFGWWDGVNFHTGNIYVGVEEVAQFGNYGFVPFEDEDTDGLDLVRVGG
jgi:hypothetical protein